MKKIAQIGCGHWGKNLARNFSEIGALAAVVDGHAETAEKMLHNYNVPARTFEDVLDDPSIDGLAFATPAETHAALAMQAIKAGKHVYVEKPLALTTEDAEAMIALAAAEDRILMVGHLLQYHPVFMALKQHVQAGLVGDIHYLYSNRLSLGKFRVEENVLWSFAPHDVSMLLGIVQEEPVVVTAQGGAFITPGVADWCTTQLVFPGGARGHIQTSWLHPFKEQRLVVVGSSGMMVFDDAEADWGKKLHFYKHSVDISSGVPVPTKADVEYLPVDKGEPLKAECQHFVDSIENGVAPRTDGHEGLAVLKVLNQAEQALQVSLLES